MEMSPELNLTCMIEYFGRGSKKIQRERKGFSTNFVRTSG
jgi:hypothetical protein